MTSTEMKNQAAPPGLRRWLRDPLLHFLLIGVALFCGYRWLNPPPERADRADQIVLTSDDLRQIAIAWMAQGRGKPTPEQVTALVEGKIREEVLYREALALGLDRDDTIVKRRLAQKMEFLAEDASSLREPDRPELETWYRAHAEAFAAPPRVSFTHIYFSSDKRGEAGKDEAAKALGAVAGQPRGTPDASKLGDPFMFQDSYGDRTPAQILSLFGPDFATALFQAAPGSWQGPIRSGYGWHLVYVDGIMPARVPALAEVEPEVRTEWIAGQRARAKEQAFAAMRARYEVVMPEEDTRQAGLAAAAAVTP
ncbi:MAG: peptidylprolyl isomerase [Microvirga sp.]